MADKHQGITNIIGKGAFLNGKLKIAGSIRIDGKVDGEIDVSDSLIVGKGSEIKGNIKAKNSIIGGKIIGDIYTQGKIEFQSGSRIKGNIYCKSLVIEEGVNFDGSCSMSEEKSETPSLIKEEKSESFSLPGQGTEH